MVLELQRAQGMRDALERIRQRMRVVVHRVDRPAGPRCDGGARIGSGRAPDPAGSCWASACRCGRAAPACLPHARPRASPGSRSRLSSAGRSLKGESCPGSRQGAAAFPYLVGALARRHRHGRRRSGSRRNRRGVRSSRWRNKGRTGHPDGPSRIPANGSSRGWSRRIPALPWRDWCRRNACGSDRRNSARCRSSGRSTWRDRCGGSRSVPGGKRVRMAAGSGGPRRCTAAMPGAPDQRRPASEPDCRSLSIAWRMKLLETLSVLLIELQSEVRCAATGRCGIRPTGGRLRRSGWRWAESRHRHRAPHSRGSPESAGGGCRRPSCRQRPGPSRQ